MKALTVLDQLALPVELNARLELPAAFEGVDSTYDAGRPARASLGIGVQPLPRSTYGRAIDAVARLGAGRGSALGDPPRQLTGNHERHSSTFWERKWDSVES